MSYVKKTWANGDTITSTALNNIENQVEKNEPLYFPVTLTEGEGGAILASTTATFSDVKAAVVAGREVAADVTFLDEGSIMRFPFRVKDAADPTLLQFVALADLGSTESPGPVLIQLTFTSGGLTATSVLLTPAEE